MELIDKIFRKKSYNLMAMRKEHQMWNRVVLRMRTC